MRRVVLLISTFALVIAACGDGTGVPLGDAAVPVPASSDAADGSNEAADLSEAAPETGTTTTLVQSDDTRETNEEPSIPDEDVVIDPPEPTKPSPPETVPSTTTIPVVTGEVPADLLEQILADAESQITTKAAMTIVRAEAVTWPDGSLGCPEPGMDYTMALVDGYWVVLDAGGQMLDYRASTSGSFKLCPESMGVPPVGGGNT